MSVWHREDQPDPFADLAAQVVTEAEALTDLDLDDLPDESHLDERAAAILWIAMMAAVNRYGPRLQCALRTLISEGRYGWVVSEFGPAGEEVPHAVVVVGGKQVCAVPLPELVNLDDL